MRRGVLIGVVVLAFAAITATATAAEALQRGFTGAFELKGTHGYSIFGMIGSTGKTGVVTLFVDKPGKEFILLAHGEVTLEKVDIDLGPFGKIDVEVRPTGMMETVRSKCGGKPDTLEGAEYVGTIEFHGEEGFTDAEASQTPLQFAPFLNIVCGGVGFGETSGEGEPGVRFKAKQPGGPTLQLNQNHVGAPVVYSAKVSEKEGDIRVLRAVTGRLGPGSLSFEPTLGAATFSAGKPFSGTAAYRGTTPPHGTRPGSGTWRGGLKVDFPGRAGVPAAGPGFAATLISARRSK